MKTVARGPRRTRKDVGDSEAECGSPNPQGWVYGLGKAHQFSSMPVATDAEGGPGSTQFSSGGQLSCHQQQQAYNERRRPPNQTSMPR